MALDLTLKINNQLITDHNDPIRIIDSHPIINWFFDQVNRVVIDEYTGIASEEEEYGQSIYNIRISTSSINIGTDSFIGNRIQTGEVNSQERFWKYGGIDLVRGQRYYGQIKIKDDADRESSWETFSFEYNNIPYVAGVVISPVDPTVSDDLILTYNFYDLDNDSEDGTIIRWFKNGIYQKQFDNATTIGSDYLQNEDIWIADVYPSDGFEYGIRVSSQHVQVRPTNVVLSDVSVLPASPNPNDILKANYISSSETEQENVSIRWFINDNLQTDYNDNIYIRPDISEGDEVRVEIKPDNGNIYFSSETVTTSASDFVVSDITVDGRTEPLDVSSITPSVKWHTFIPDGKEANYVSIKIGTFFESGNIYSQIFNFDRETFTIPSGILNRGRDYYISVAVSDTQTFSKYTSTHFRIKGSRWDTSANNLTGWTIEMLFIVDGVESNSNESSPATGTTTPTVDTSYKNHQVLRINDGEYFAEIQIYEDKITLISGGQKEYNADSIFNGSKILTVAGKGNDIKVYLDRNLIIDGAGIFTQSTNITRLELGSPNDSNFVIRYKYLFYTTSGYYLPGISSEYSNLQFHTFIEFSENEVVALNGYINGGKIFALNPDNTNESSSIYALVSGDVKKYPTVNRTFAPINRLNKSPDGKYVVGSHSHGVSLITGYQIGTYNNELLFINENGEITNIDPCDYGWELVKDVNFDAVYFNEDGFNINTLGII